MNTPLAALGWAMFVCLGVLSLRSGLPVWALLTGVATAFAGFGVLAGGFDVQVLGAIGARTLGLLDNDLLQALPLYVFVGVLLQRLGLADTLFRALQRLLHFTGAATPLSALLLGVLLAPMNGSVSATSSLLGRSLAPQLARLGALPALAVISAASTIGVVVPPSLVLLLLGDAMLRAHTEASNLPGYVLGSQRIINSQDVFHAALLPAGLTLLLWILVCAVRSRQASPCEAPPRALTRAEWLLSAAFATVLGALLAGVFAGMLFAVEAAATAALLLVAGALASGRLKRQDWREVLWLALAQSGALLALLLGATTFSMVFRLFGSDAWLAGLVLQSGLPPPARALTLLLLVAACAWILDAFEMIFLIIPVVAPLLIVLLGDAQQTAVLLLLVLQLSFLVPPMGYAVLMARIHTQALALPLGTVWRALGPFVLAQGLVMAAVFVVPQLSHALDDDSQSASAALPVQDVEQLMRSMGPDSR